MSDTVTTRQSSPEVREIIAALVAGLSGRATDHEALVRGIRLRVGMVALMLIQESFIEKSRGGTGEDGIRWDPLTRATIAARRVGPGDKHLLKGIRDKGGSRPYLTEAEDKRWRVIYGTRKAALMGKHGMSPEAASARAAQIAWATLKGEGAKTKLQVLGGRNVSIGRDTNRMFASLSPGIPDPSKQALDTEPPPPPAPAEADDRILRDEPGAIIVGSNVDYAGRFHARRKLWPTDGSLPASWASAVAGTAKEGIVEALVMVLAA